MVIRTAQGNVVETLAHNGYFTPFRFKEFVVIRVAVDGQPCPSFEVPVTTWESEAGEMAEPDFWQHVADSALTMRELEAARQI